MQQVPAESAFQGSQAQGSGSLQSRRSGGDPPQGTRAPAGRPKKRERNETICDSVKQQRIDRTDERVGSQKAEAPSLVGKDGGLCSVASVDRLVCIMMYEWNDSMQRPVDLMVSRTMLAKVIAATVELDCLFRFLKLGGLNVLDRWLQEAHTGRPLGEIETAAEGDKAVDDLLFALLGALERLPVDLVTLKTCSIGKSVNFLRTHKHPDIQRRARKLVDTWKRRVESEMEDSGEARPSVEQSSYPQQVDMKVSHYSHFASHAEHPAPIECSGVGRGKYASVATLCSSPESHSKASSTTIPMSCSVDTSSKCPLTPLKPSNENPQPAFNTTLHSSYGRPHSSEDGRAVSSACVPGPCNNQTRAAKSTGGSRHRKSSNLSFSNTSSVATALSGSVFGSKDYTEQGPATERSAHGASLSSATEVWNLPCCTFVQKVSDNVVVYDHPSRSTINSASSCVADCKEKVCLPITHNQQQVCSEPVKTGIQLLASIAASESSTIDVKSPDSPSVKSIGPQRVNTLSTERKIPAEGIMKSHYCQLVKAGGNLQAREHYDRNSSTVSSPSETSTHDTHTCENKRASAVYENIHSPADTTSETSLPSSHASKDVGRKRGASTSSLSKECGKAESLCDKSKKPCLQPALVAEAVGESSTVDKLDRENRVNATPEILDNLIARKVFTQTSPPSRCSDNGSLEAVRQAAVEGEQVGMACKPTRASSDGNPPPYFDTAAAGGSRDAFALVGSKQNSLSAFPSLDVPFSAVNGKSKNSPLGAHACSTHAYVNTIEQKQRTLVDGVAASTREEIQRPVFDLNEMLSGGEEGPVQASGPISNMERPIQGFSLLASDSIPSLPVVPMTPIAVVAAAKGPFTLPAISRCRPPTGEPGWKGSAATSAFRPTQPRRSLEKGAFSMPEQTTHGKTVLDFDLNIAADSISFVDEKHGSADIVQKSKSTDVKVASKQSVTEATASSAMSREACERVRASWDLNQADEAAVESGTKLDLDLNNGPIVQDNDDVVLAAKHIRMKDPLPSMNPVASNRLPVHSISPITPILMPAYAMPNSDIPYPASGAMPWLNGRPHDGLLQYNIFMQNPSAFASSGMACAPLSSIAAGPFQAIPFGFSSASMQGFSAPCGEALATPQSAAAIPHLPSVEPLMASHSKPSHVMGVLADAVHQQGMAGFWNRPSLDLNAGPDTIDPSNTKDDKRHMRAMNEPMRTRPQVVDMANALQQREQEGRIGMPGSMQGVPLKQSVWR